MSVEHSALSDEFLPLLDELNRIVKASGVPLEGNLYYYHQEANPSRDTIYDYFFPKRQNYAAVCRAAKRMLEIGVNAGHSALLALANGIEYHGVDICQHPYTRPTAAFLKARFGDRFHLYEGDSLKVVPEMAINYPSLRFDLLHIDGHHGVDFCRKDTANAIPLSLADAWIMIDDTDLPEIADFYREQVEAGIIRPAKPEGWVDNHCHVIGKIVLY